MVVHRELVYQRPQPELQQWQLEQQQQEQRELGGARQEIKNVKTELKLRQEYDYRAILNAYLDCRKVKRNKVSAMAFEVRFERNLMQLLDEINSGRYQIGRSEVFVVTHPKAREIWAAQFRDRIVHHLIHNDIGAYLESKLIEDTFSCIKGRGTLAASDRLVQLHRRVTNHYETDCFALQFDIKNFFVSIDKAILWSQFERYIGPPESSLTARLLHQVIWNNPAKNPVIKPNSPFNLVPRHKSLWLTGGNTGLPIGNLTSQTASNIYMNGFDHFVKHVLKCAAYVRYVDDAIILSKDKNHLLKCLKEIEDYLKAHLGLTIHPDKCSITPASQGVNFVGYIVKPYRRYTRKTTIEAAKKACNEQEPFDARSRVDSMNSYLGLMRNTNSYKARRELCRGAAIPTLVTHDREFKKLVLL